jgi:diguanylate cyclase (GGDEF)-like protein
MLSRLPLRQIFLAVCAVFAVPIAVLAYLLFESERRDIAFAEKERAGVAYLKAIAPAYAAAARGEQVDLAPVVLAGDLYNGAMNVWPEWRAFRVAVERDSDPENTMSRGAELIRAVGDGSNLILDPKLDSYYLMDAVVIRLPSIINEVADISRLAAQQQARARVDAVRLSVQSSLLRHNVGHLRAGLDAAFRHNLDGSVSRFLEAEFVSAGLALEDLDRAATGLAEARTDAQRRDATVRFTIARDDALDALNTLNDVALIDLDRLLAERIERITTALWSSLGFAGLATLLALVMAFVIAGRIALVFRELAQRLHDLTRGAIAFDVPFMGYANEIGLMARSLAVCRDHAVERFELSKTLARNHAEREADLERIAYQDDLTGLPNRKHLHRAFAEFLAAGKGEARGALLYLDIDRFKEINDTLGHQAGDALICAAAERLKGLARPDDIVARISGDEFAILLGDVDDPEIVQHFGARLLHRLSEPYEISAGAYHITVSIGVALVAPNQAHDPQELLRRADVALYRAKERGRNCCVMFDSVFDADVLYRRRVESALRGAIASEQVRLAFQPQVCAESASLVGVEALARWEDSKLGVISPGVFIPVAENSGLIVDLGKLILRQAFEHAKRWPHMTVAVNLSVLQLRDKGFVDMLATMALDSGVDTGRMELEMTESILLEDVVDVNEKLRQIKALGFRLALDDFGTGYSSLSYLTRFEFDKLKIDRSFVQNLENSPHARTVMRSIAALGRAVGLDVCAEGVETESQLEVVRDVGCTSVQGYYYMPAVSAGEIDRLVAQGKDLTPALARRRARG